MSDRISDNLVRIIQTICLTVWAIVVVVALVIK